jgi:hypothetical protein
VNGYWDGNYTDAAIHSLGIIPVGKIASMGGKSIRIAFRSGALAAKHLEVTLTTLSKSSSKLLSERATGFAVKLKLLSEKGAAANDLFKRLPRNTKLPVFAQHTPVACGPTAARMLMSTLNPASKYEIVKQYVTGKFGVYITEVRDILIKYGFKAKWESKWTTDMIAKATAGRNPIVAHVKGHFVIVDGVTIRNGQRVVAIRDPWKGTQYFESVIEFEKRFTGNVVHLP